MIGIILTFLAAFLGLILLIAFSLRRDKPSSEKAAIGKKTCVPVAGLSAVSLPFSVIVGREDYLKLGTTPELRPVRKMFWRDRRRIVLMWLNELRKDVGVLWKFRRFLVGNGLPATFREEAGVAFVALLALLFLRVVGVNVFFFGPFVLYKAIERGGLVVEWLSRFVSAPLTRVSAARKAEIEQLWSQQLLAISMR